MKLKLQVLLPIMFFVLINPILAQQPIEGSCGTVSNSQNQEFFTS